MDEKGKEIAIDTVYKNLIGLNNMVRFGLDFGKTFLNNLRGVD